MKSKMMISLLVLLLVSCNQSAVPPEKQPPSEAQVSTKNKTPGVRAGYVATPEIEATFWIVNNRLVLSYECPKCHLHFKDKQEAANCYVDDVLRYATPKNDEH